MIIEKKNQRSLFLVTSFFVSIAWCTASVQLLAQAPQSLGIGTQTVWSQFRGHRFNNVASDTRLPEALDLENAVKWKVPLASGASTPVFWGERFVVTTFDGSKLYTECRSITDGSLIWNAVAPNQAIEEFFALLGSPAAPSCSVDAERIVAYFGSFGLICYDWDGKKLWQVPMAIPQTRDGFGTGTSPLLNEKTVYLQRDEDGPNSGIYAFNAETGEIRWRTNRDGFRVSFGSPIIWDGALVTIGDVRVKGYELSTGEERWTIVGTAAYPCTSPTVGEDGRLFIATWSPGSANERNMPPFVELVKTFDTDLDGRLSKANLHSSFVRDFFDVNDKNKNGFLDQAEYEADLKFFERGKNVVMAIAPGGRGNITETHVAWRGEKGAPYVASPLVYRGRVFLIKDGGLLTTYDADSGKLLSGPARIGATGDYYASPLGIDGKVIVISISGVLSVLSGDDPSKLLHTLDFKERVWASPVVRDTTLYIRTETQLYAIGN
jgi:outer membrane protein assembly factor BamB